MGGIALEKSEKTRLSVTVTGLYVDTLNHLVEKGIFTTRGEVFRAALRRIFWAYGLEPFADKGAKLEDDKVPKAVAS